jgi:elongation factor G
MVPAAELLTYAAELRSLSSGLGTVTMRYDHHDEVPDNVARRVLQSNAQPV